MTQVYNSLSREIVMYVQKDLQTALLAAPMEYEALRKEYGSGIYTVHRNEWEFRIWNSY